MVGLMNSRVTEDTDSGRVRPLPPPIGSVPPGWGWPREWACFLWSRALVLTGDREVEGVLAGELGVQPIFDWWGGRGGRRLLGEGGVAFFLFFLVVALGALGVGVVVLLLMLVLVEVLVPLAESKVGGNTERFS